MMTRLSVHSRPAWKLIILGGSLTFLLTLYTMHPSSAPLKQSLYGMLNNQAPLQEIVHTGTGCTPQQWSAGQWRSIPPRAKPEVTRPEDVLALDGFEGCAADREYYWHLGADQDQWSRFPDVASYVWTPPGECNARPLEKEEMVRDMVEEGGWLLIGDSVTENHFFSLSCLLYPHVRATPNYTLNPFFDRAWPQHLYLNPDSPLVPHLRLPSGFNISSTPLVTFRRVDLLLTQDQLRDIYGLLHPDRLRAAIASSEDGKFDILGGDAVWEVQPEEYMGMLTSPDTNYGTIIASTGGHWTVGTFPGLKDPELPGEGIQNVLDFFEETMPVWATIVQSYLSDVQKSGKAGRGWTNGGRKRRVVVRAYLPGHDGCHNHHSPWTRYEQADMWLSYNWGQIGTFNKIFERAVSVPQYPDIHFLPIDMPALLRPDAHAGSDCLHLITGTGVLEGWSHYIWHYTTRELGPEQ